MLLFTAGTEGSQDIRWAQEAAEILGLPIQVACISDTDTVVAAARAVKGVIRSDNYVKISVALPFWFALQEAKKADVSRVITGLGSEELFAGYQRHVEADDRNAECIRGLLDIQERDLDRDSRLLAHFGMQPGLPFLDRDTVLYALRMPASLKIQGDVKKYIIRKVALANGVPERFAMRPKKAAQYGSGYDKLLGKLARQQGIRKGDFVGSL